MAGLAHPDTASSGHTGGRQPECRHCPDEDGFQIAHVPVHVAAVRPQVENGVPDELTGTVISHVAATPGFEYRYATLLELAGTRDNVRTSAAMAHTDGQDRRV